jgi:hypothetical protein
VARQSPRVLTCAAALWLVGHPSHADGIDLVRYFARVGGEHSLAITPLLVVLLLLANYALNMLVIGLPAVKSGPAGMQSIAVDLVVLTLLGQVADRVGALAAGLGEGPLTNILGLQGEGAWLWPLLALNFVFSGIAVGALALYFLRRRWQVRRRSAWWIAGIAAILTNPAWVIGTWWM